MRVCVFVCVAGWEWDGGGCSWAGGWGSGGAATFLSSAGATGEKEKKKSLEMSGSLRPANRNEADCQSASIVSTVNPAWVSADKEQLRRSNEKRGTF